MQRHSEASRGKRWLRLSHHVPSVGERQLLVFRDGIDSDHQMWFINVGGLARWLTFPHKGIAGCGKILDKQQAAQIQLAREGA